VEVEEGGIARGENEGGAAMDKDYLELRRAALSRRSDERNDDDFDVLPDDEVVATPLMGSPWMWTFIFPHHARQRTVTSRCARLRWRVRQVMG
jgi:hypothetical protein